MRLEMGTVSKRDKTKHMALPVVGRHPGRCALLTDGYPCQTDV